MRCPFLAAWATSFLSWAIGLGEQVGMRRRHVEPGGKAGEAGTVPLHVGDRGGRRQLGA